MLFSWSICVGSRWESGRCKLRVFCFFYFLFFVFPGPSRCCRLGSSWELSQECICPVNSCGGRTCAWLFHHLWVKSQPWTAGEWWLNFPSQNPERISMVALLPVLVFKVNIKFEILAVWVCVFLQTHRTIHRGHSSLSPPSLLLVGAVRFIKHWGCWTQRLCDKSSFGIF